MEISREEFEVLEREGQEIFMKQVADDLNRFSNKFIRLTEEDWRRQSDFAEVCVALALLKRKTAL